MPTMRVDHRPTAVARACAGPPPPHSEAAAAASTERIAALEKKLALEVAQLEQRICAPILAEAKPLVEKMRSEDAKVARDACDTMTNLAWYDFKKEPAGEAGAVEAAVAAMKTHGTDAGVVSQACRALINLSCNTDKNRSRAGAAGAVEAAAAALQRHESDAEVAEKASWALCNMCCGNADNEARAAKAGAVRALLVALDTHGASRDKLAVNGCWALDSITARADGLAAIKSIPDAATVLKKFTSTSGKKYANNVLQRLA